MTDNRYNVFNQIHKGLRALLYDTALCIQQTDFSKDDASETINKISLVVDLFDEHAHHEDTYILPLVAAHDTAMVDDFEKDHEIDHKLSDALREQVNEWTKAATKSERIAIGQSLFFSFNEFVAFNLYHMNKEENQLLYSLWKHNSDETLLQAQQAIIASINPEILMIESRWMMRSLNNDEIIKWLTGVKIGAPEEVYNIYLKMAEEELPTNRYQSVISGLIPELVAA